MTQSVDPPLVVEGTTPYPWPFDAALSPSRLALVVAGWDDGWWRRCHEALPVAATILRLAGAVERVVCITHRNSVRQQRWDPPLGHGAPPVIPGAVVITAAGIDSFHGGPLDTLLRDERRDQLAIVGLGLETTVHSTMRSANDRGYECLLVADACAAVDPTVTPHAISMVEMSGGIFGAVGLADDLLAGLDRSIPLIPAKRGELT